MDIDVDMNKELNSRTGILSVEIFHSYFSLCRLVGLLLKRVEKLGISKELVKLFISIHKVDKKLLVDKCNRG